MGYNKYTAVDFFLKVKTEEKARELVWKSKFNGKDFVCRECNSESYFQYKTEPEIKKCKNCGAHIRMRVGTIFENSKLPILLWLRALHFMMDSKRGISALELQRKLSIGSNRTALSLLRRVRRALQQRDERYKLKNIVELDGTGFGKKATGNFQSVLVAIETKDWIDEKGRQKSKAGFAKIIVGHECPQTAQELIDTGVEAGTLVNTDGSKSFKKLKNVEQDYRDLRNDKEKINEWLPWVHKFISNAKTWILGTHHGVSAKNLELYLAEYTYRFNRRHDPNGLFHRALVACTASKRYIDGRLSA